MPLFESIVDEAPAQTVERAAEQTTPGDPGICTEPALAQAQFNLSQILVARADSSQAADGMPLQTDAEVPALLEESALLAERARKVLTKSHPLGPFARRASDDQGRQFTMAESLTKGPYGIPMEHELALFDHLQPVFDGRFTGLHLLQYLRESG